eukprot:475657-Prorocentrum_minimum.AAC.1
MEHPVTDTDGLVKYVSVKLLKYQLDSQLTQQKVDKKFSKSKSNIKAIYISRLPDAPIGSADIAWQSDLVYGP